MAVGETVGPGARSAASSAPAAAVAARDRGRPAPVESATDEDATEEADAARQGSRSRARAPARRGRRDRAPHAPAPRDAAIPRRRGLGLHDVDAAEGPPPQDPARPHDGHGQGWHAARLRRLRDPGARAGLDHEPPDRSRPYRDDPLHQAWREGVDQHLPRQARHPEAGRDAHGLGQGQPRALGRGREAGPRDVRALGCARGRSRARRCASRCTSSRSRPASSCGRRRRDHDEAQQSCASSTTTSSSTG